MSATPSPSAASRHRDALPEGTSSVGIGLAIGGVASYLFFKVGAAALGEDGFASVSKLWFATFAIAPGVFLPLEQEASRALAHRMALGVGGAPVMRRVALLGGAACGALGLVLLALGPVLARHYFAGNGLMVVALALAILAYAPIHLVRGICSGTGRFRSYAVIVGADGVMRIVLCGALGLLGMATAGTYGLAVAAAPLFGLAWVLIRRGLHLQPGPDAPWSEVTPNLGWLLLGSICAAVLVNIGPIALGMLATDSQESLVTQFSYGVLVTRVPLFFFQAVQAALLPRLARLAARGQVDEFSAGFRRLLGVVTAVATIGVLGAATVGPWVIDLVYGAQLARTTITLLALASGGYMVALATAQALIALQGHAAAALGWAAGLATFLVTTALAGDDLVIRVEWGLVASSAAALAVFTIALRLRTRLFDPGPAAGAVFRG